MALDKVSSSVIATDTITASQIAPNAVGSSELADDAVTNAKIGVDAVSTTEIANNASISTSGNIASTIVQTNSLKDKTGTRVLASDSGSAWSWGAGLPSGSIIQVQNTQYTSTCSTTNIADDTNYVLSDGTASGTGSGILDVNITPSISGSKIWLQCCWCGEFDHANDPHNTMFFFWRDTTKLGHATAGGRQVGVQSPSVAYGGGSDAGSTMEVLFMQYFDTHGINVGTQITYKVGFQTRGDGQFLHTNKTKADTDGDEYERGVSSICAIELAP